MANDIYGPPLYTSPYPMFQDGLAGEAVYMGNTMTWKVGAVSGGRVHGVLAYDCDKGEHPDIYPVGIHPRIYVRLAIAMFQGNIASIQSSTGRFYPVPSDFGIQRVYCTIVQSGAAGDLVEAVWSRHTEYNE